MADAKRQPDENDQEDATGYPSEATLLVRAFRS
jgi:hypothetical protein